MKLTRTTAIYAGTLAIIIGLWSVWLELGRPTSYIAGVEIGGPDPQSLFGSAILALAGVVAVLWGRTRKHT